MSCIERFRHMHAGCPHVRPVRWQARGACHPARQPFQILRPSAWARLVSPWSANTPSYKIEVGSQTTLQSLKYAFRSLSRRPGFAVLSILALALGLGANAAIFRVFDAVLLRPLPYPDADRIVMPWE